VDPRDRCVVVTGGGHGIGRALAERFARDGARVVVADVHLPRAEKIAARIGGMAVHCDVGDPDAVADLVARAVDAYGPVYAFCSNAGITDPGPDLGSTPDQVRAIVDVNLLAHVWAAQAVVPAMLEQGEGYLAQTISSAGLISGPAGMGYTLTKHGALGFAEWLAVNHAHQGLRVACLCPNLVNTGMTGRDEDAPDDGPAAGNPRLAGFGDVVEPEQCADMTVDALREGRFLVLPHPRVGESFTRKAADYDDWIAGTNRRLRRMRGEEA
jgi:NAD(P)-dependent dehydrogenase (short-subunit alcohol dehydrogenase family)